MKKISFKKKFFINAIIFVVLIAAVYSWITLFSTPPTLSELTEIVWDGTTIANKFDGGNGTETNPYQISNGAEFYYFKTLIENDESYNDLYYKLTNNINLGNHEWSPIGDNINLFKGNFNGNGYTIKNYTINNPSVVSNNEYYGIFAIVFDAHIYNLNIENANISIANTANFINAGSICGSATNTTFSNISVRGDLDNFGNAGALIGMANNVNANNIYSNTNLTIGGVIGHATNSIIDNIITNVAPIATNTTPEIDNNPTETNIYMFNHGTIILDGNNIDINVVVSNLNTTLTDECEWYFDDDLKIRFVETSSNLESMNNYALERSVNNIELHESGISEDTVYVNDMEADWNYYKGLNYTYTSTGTIPTGTAQDLYNENNLIKVQVNYSGIEPHTNLTGYVSPNERQNKFTYYKTYVVETNGTESLSDDYIKIPLIDNPFTDRPTDMGFNNWVSMDNDITIEHDTTLYKRYAIVPITYTNGKPDEAIVDFYVSWVKANVATATGTSSWSNLFSNLNTAGMKELDFYRTYRDSFNMAGYFYSHNVGFLNSYAGYYNSSGTYQSSGTCRSLFGCTYYEIITGGDYNPNNTYYHVKNGSMQIASESDIPLVWHTDIYPEYTDSNMAGYFRQAIIPNGSSIVGYYNANGEYQSSGNCSTSGGCTYYSMIKYYNGSSEEIVDTDQTYYYLATRDTNIIFMNGSLSGAWSSSENKPFTLTSVHNGTDNRNLITWSVYNTSVNAYNDTNIENIRINSGNTSANTDPTGSAGTNAYLYGNYHNLRVGRGITQLSNYKNFIGIIGGTNSSTGSSTDLTRYNLIIESGMYNSIANTNGSIVSLFLQTNTYVDGKITYGNDYDRINNNNSNLDVYYCASGSWGGNIYSSTDTGIAIDLTVKSGTFGSGKYDHTTGIYIGGRSNGTHHAARKVTYEGGYTYNLIGGPLTASDRENLNDTYAYIKGGQVDMVIGGAGTTTTYGNRIISVTGGTINYSVFGGSNGYNGNSRDGKLSGDTFIYVGGNAEIGSSAYVANNSELFGSEAGSVFGIGNGKSGSTSIGSCDNSNIVIAEQAIIHKNVYGGGNFGATGINSDSSVTTTKITVTGGTVEGAIYGGGNKNGSGSDSIESTIDIDVIGGNINKIYGGSNDQGTIYGDVNIDVTGGNVNSIYGGGEGGYLNTSSVGTFVTGNINLEIGDINGLNYPTIGSVYGGSAFGTVNGDTNTTAVSDKTTNVTINNGIITNSVFGGGQGSSSYTPYVEGNVTVDINGGNIAYVFGGNDAAGTPNGTVYVNLNGGIVGSAFGGGNNSSLTTTHIELDGADATSIFGGSNSTGNVATSNVTITAGEVDKAYGGNNVGGTTITSNVIVNGGTVVDSIYGGGKATSTTTTNLHLNSGNINNAYGGGESADAPTTNVYLDGANVTGALYGGSNTTGLVNNSYITVTTGHAEKLYGGNNKGGSTTTPLINVNGGSVTELFGGGNIAQTSNNTINIIGGTVYNVYGGGNRSITTGNTDVNLTNANITGSVFGGGNIGDVNGNTYLDVKDSNISIDTYGGGNQANVVGNAYTNVSGNTTIGRNLFGGGNSGTIGTVINNNVLAQLNVTGAVVGRNVYGGSNTSVVYGRTDVNIGYDAVVNNSLTKGNIDITGTIFGGGEANAAGSPTYDFEFICVTRGIDINIDGNGYTDGLVFKMNGSIFGSGNASSSSGTSNIYINNLGTKASPSKNISIQRATNVVIDNSVMELSGTTDRTNDYSTIKYSFNRITLLKIKNNTTLLLRENANLLHELQSLVDIDGEEVKASVSINDTTKEVTKNVDNRIYLLANKIFNVTTNQDASTFGAITGMTFFGMYTSFSNGTFGYGFYDNSFDYGDAADAGDVIAGGSYIIGLHNINHDITKDGFYTNYIDDEYTNITTAYIEPTPPGLNYYRWTIGIKAIEYSFDLTASKYSSLGTYKLSLHDFEDGDTTFQVLGFNIEGLSDGVTMVDSNNVPRVANSTIANSTLGLSMKTETTEWTNYGTTKFLSNDNGSFTGTPEYRMDSQASAPNLMFYLYHAKNISLDANLGTVVISLQAVTPINEIEDKVQLITITIELYAKTFTDGDAYDASITYDKKYDIPARTTVNITNRSQMTSYFALYADATSVNDFYGLNNDYYHALVTNSVLPIGTAITMIDYGTNENNPEYYYYIVNENDYNDAVNQLATYNEVTYRLSNFIKMDSADDTNRYNDAIANQAYFHDSDQLIMEEFIFIFDFKETTESGNKLNNTVLFELRNNEDRSIVSVLSIRQDLMTYNLYETSNVVLEETVSIDDGYIYYNNEKDINYVTNISYDLTSSLEQVIDTNYESISMGLNAILYDSSNNKISSSLLTGTSIFIDGNSYFADSDGTFRIKLTDKVANINRSLKFLVNTDLPVGDYSLELILFASGDGLHISNNLASDTEILNLTLVGNDNLIVADSQDEIKVIDSSGLNGLGTKVESYTINYSSVLTNPNIRMAMYKRGISDSNDITYEEYDMKDLFINSLSFPAIFSLTGGSQYEYMVTNNPSPTNTIDLTLKNTLTSGTYKLVFKLYDNNYLVDEDIEYIIIKKPVAEET